MAEISDGIEMTYFETSTKGVKKLVGLCSLVKWPFYLVRR